MAAYKFTYKNQKQWPAIQAALTLNEVSIISKNGTVVEVNVTDKKVFWQHKAEQGTAGRQVGEKIVLLS